MRIPTSVKRALGVSATLAIIAGCSSGGSQQLGSTPTGPMQTSARAALHARGHDLANLAARVGLIGAAQAGHYKSQMDHVKKDIGNRLLYISDYYNNVVQVYNYPSDGSQKSPAGTLTGFADPQGECSDNTQHNVFIANTYTSQIFEYAYGATSPELVIGDPGNAPVGCSVDAKGDLAVSNIQFGAGSISVYTAPLSSSSTPKIYANDSIASLYFLAYDDKGDIFADGFAPGSTTVVLAKLSFPKGTFKDLNVSNIIKYPGGVNWDSKRGYVTVGDQDSPTHVYGYKVAGSSDLRWHSAQLITVRVG